jgi:hypothetical protein
MFFLFAGRETSSYQGIRKAVVGMCPRNPKASQNEIHQRTSRIGTGQVAESFGAVIAAQTWHRVDPVGGAAKAVQAVRPGGRLAVFWNAFQPPPGLGDAFAGVSRQVMPNSPPPATPEDLLAGIGAAITRPGAASPCVTRRWQSPQRATALLTRLDASFRAARRTGVCTAGVSARSSRRR